MKIMMKMSILLPLFFIFHTTIAHDITQSLNQFPDFSNYNSYLTQTGLAVVINGRQPITLLVVDNANVAPLSSKPVDVIKNILSVHIILDYFDLPKLQTLSTTTALPTTFFQTTGLARGQQGFLNVTRLGGGTIAFVSAMPGSSGPSTFIKSVYSEPYNLSVLQISSPIVPQGIDGAKTSSPPSTTPGATPPTPSTLKPPSTATPPLAAAQVSTPPASSLAPPKPAAAAIPSMAPPTAAKAPIPSTVPTPKASAAPIPSKIPPTSRNSPLPSSIPPKAATSSLTPAAAPDSDSDLAPGAEAPESEVPGETTPAQGAPKAKSAGKSLDLGLALIFAMVLSTSYLASSTI